jgi:hypothetical protein
MRSTRCKRSAFSSHSGFFFFGGGENLDKIEQVHEHERVGNGRGYLGERPRRVAYPPGLPEKLLSQTARSLSDWGK